MINMKCFCLKTFSFLVVKFSIYLNRHVFVMCDIHKKHQTECIYEVGKFSLIGFHLFFLPRNMTAVKPYVFMLQVSLSLSYVFTSVRILVPCDNLNFVSSDFIKSVLV